STASTQETIAREANQGIRYFNASAAVDEEIKALVDTDKVLDTELNSFRNLYEDLKKKF
ncbi:hypothetical protein A2U01_0054792, partial [Trifolium medium]|nr:hypothetical protein [Trifolium medium]